MQTLLKTCIGLLLVCGFSSANATAIERKHYGAWEQKYGYSQVVKVGRNLYISGMTADGKDMSEQVKGVYGAIGKILQDYNADFSHVVRETVFTRDIQALRQASEVRKAFFKNAMYPASSWIQIDKLFYEKYLIEVEAQVYLPE